MSTSQQAARSGLPPAAAAAAPHRCSRSPGPGRRKGFLPGIGIPGRFHRQHSWAACPAVDADRTGRCGIGRRQLLSAACRTGRDAPRHALPAVPSSQYSQPMMQQTPARMPVAANARGRPAGVLDRSSRGIGLGRMTNMMVAALLGRQRLGVSGVSMGERAVRPCCAAPWPGLRAGRAPEIPPSCRACNAYPVDRGHQRLVARSVSGRAPPPARVSSSAPPWACAIHVMRASKRLPDANMRWIRTLCQETVLVRPRQEPT